jgi:hypothetical protein
VLVCDSNVIHSHHLPPTLQTAEVSGTVTALTLKSAVEAFERGLIQDTLKSTKGNIAKAARQLDSTERILSYKIRNYGIDSSGFGPSSSKPAQINRRSSRLPDFVLVAHLVGVRKKSLRKSALSA